MVPLARIAVTAEDHGAVLVHGALEHGEGGLLEGNAAVELFLQPIGDPLERIGQDRVQRHQGARHRLPGAHRPEFEAIAGEGKGGGAVAIAGILVQLWQGVDPEGHQGGLGGTLQVAALDLVKHILQLAAEVHRDDRWRGLIGAEAVVVAGGGDDGPQQGAEAVHAADHRRAEDQELQVGVGGLAGIEQVALGGIADRPVHVLAAAVDAGEGLLMQQAGEAMPLGRAAEHGHRELLVVGGHVRGLEIGGDLELAGSHLVVAGLGWDAEPVELVLHVLHEHLHPLRDGPEVVVVELLTLGRRSAEEGATGQQQIGPQGVVAGIDQEVLLLGAAAGVHRGDLLFAEQPQQPLGLFVHGGVGTQQGRLLVERLAGPAYEHRGDAERHAVGGAHQPGGAGDIPGGVAAGLEGGAQAAVREGGAVGLTLHQQLAGELGDRRTIGLGRDEAVVFLGGEVGEGIENVCIIEGAAGAGPVLHRLGHHVGHRGVELAAFADRALDRAEYPLGQR